MNRFRPRGRPPASDPQRPSFAKASLATFGTQVGAALIGLVNVLVMSRILGPAGRGDVVFLTTITMLTAGISSIGVGQANVNLAGSRPAVRPALATNSLLFAVAFGALAAGVLAALIELVPSAGGDVDSTLRWVALASVPLLILKHYLFSLLQADYRFSVINSLWLLTPLLQLTVNGLLGIVGALTVGVAFAAWVTGQALEVSMAAGYLVTRLAGFGRPRFRLARETVAFGAKAYLGRVMLLGNYRLDQWILGSVAGSRELGLYSVAVAWAEALFYLPQAFTMVQRPDLVRATRAQAAAQAARVFRISVLLTAPIAVAMVVLAPFLCVIVFGEEFRGSIDDLRVLAAGALGVAGLKTLGDALTAQRRPLLETAAIGIAFLFTVGLDAALIPLLGGLGAAIASTVAYTAGGVASAAIFCRALGAPRRDLVPRISEASWFVDKVRGALRPARGD